VEVKSCSTTTILTASASVPSDATGGPHNSNTISENPAGCSPPIAAAPPAVIASDAGTCNAPDKQPCQAQSKAASTINASASVHAGSASMTVAFTGNADATVITGGSSHADVDGGSSISFQLNTTCNYSVSGSVSASPNNVDSSAVAALRLSGSSAGAVFTLTGGSSGQEGTLTAGTYSFLTSGGATGSGSDPAGPGGHASVSNSGTLTLTC
jgi:hypothetical protein